MKKKAHVKQKLMVSDDIKYQKYESRKFVPKCHTEREEINLQLNKEVLF